MPTGYTAPIAEGKKITFQEFVMSCARAFGACVTMRDDPAGTPIPEEFKPSDYNSEELQKATLSLNKTLKWTKEQAETEAQKAYTKEMKHYNKRTEEKDAQGKRYADMLNEVVKWEPPTPDHKELKNFMIKQLQESIDFDCNYTTPEPEKLTGEQYKTQQVQRFTRDIKYHQKEHEKELDRVNKRNKWIQQLRNSLKDYK